MKYPARFPFPTRWNDNDQYGHLNNTVYYAAMDTAVNDWMIRHGGLDPHGAGPIAVCASSSCDYRASASFPESLEVGIGVERLGTSSVTWGLGILRAPLDPDAGGGDVAGEVAGVDAGSADGAEPIAVGRFVHVFVDPGTRRPTPVPESVREAIERMLS